MSARRSHTGARSIISAPPCLCLLIKVRPSLGGLQALCKAASICSKRYACSKRCGAWNSQDIFNGPECLKIHRKLLASAERRFTC